MTDEEEQAAEQATTGAARRHEELGSTVRLRQVLHGLHAAVLRRPCFFS